MAIRIEALGSGRTELVADGVACNATDVAAADAEIGQFAVGHAAEFGDCLTVAAPVVQRACDVHGRAFLSVGSERQPVGAVSI